MDPSRTPASVELLGHFYYPAYSTRALHSNQIVSPQAYLPLFLFCFFINKRNTFTAF